jgi:hypothetical protein
MSPARFHCYVTGLRGAETRPGTTFARPLIISRLVLLRPVVVIVKPSGSRNGRLPDANTRKGPEQADSGSRQPEQEQKQQARALKERPRPCP